MAGIFPEGGVNASATAGSIPNPDVINGCDALWHALACRPNFDPAAANALISELLRAMHSSDVSYDCGVFTNLADAIRIHGIDYVNTISLPSSPFSVLSGTRTIANGSFTVKNTFWRDIRVMMIGQLMTLVRKKVDSVASIQVVLDLSNASDFSDRASHLTMTLNNAVANNVISLQTSKASTFTIPAGGRTFYWRIQTIASAADTWELEGDEFAGRYRFFGTSSHTFDTVAENS